MNSDDPRGDTYAECRAGLDRREHYRLHDALPPLQERLRSVTAGQGLSAGEPVAEYETALARLVKAVESHKEAGWPACPECDDALAQGKQALLGLAHAQTLRDIRKAEDDAAALAHRVIRGQ